jgi:glyoxylase-like metal-dependent hydrolase (beta-lactamase superfamily II)
VAKWLDDQNLRPTDVLLTHQHFDHVLDAAALQARGARIHAFAPHAPTLTLENRCREWGLPPVPAYSIDAVLDLTQPLRLAGLEFTLAHIPGHSADSVTFYAPQLACVYAGDTLFRNSIGRCDLPGGDEALLLRGICQHLLSLPDATEVFSGHGSATTIGQERRHNAFLR